MLRRETPTGLTLIPAVALLLLSVGCAGVGDRPRAAPSSSGPPVRYEEQGEEEAFPEFGVTIKPPPENAKPAVTGPEALELANRETGTTADEIVVTLTSFIGFDVEDYELVWLVEYVGGCAPPGGPPGISPFRSCGEGSLWISIDATTGRFIGGFGATVDQPPTG